MAVDLWVVVLTGAVSGVVGGVAGWFGGMSSAIRVVRNVSAQSGGHDAADAGNESSGNAIVDGDTIENLVAQGASLVIRWGNVNSNRPPVEVCNVGQGWAREIVVHWEVAKAPESMRQRPVWTDTTEGSIEDLPPGHCRPIGLRIATGVNWPATVTVTWVDEGLEASGRRSNVELFDTPPKPA